MKLKPQQITENPQWKLLLELPFGKIADFVIGRLKSKNVAIIVFWVLCAVTALSAIGIRIRSGSYFPKEAFFYHSLTGLVILPLISILVHELLHLAAFRIAGAGKLKIGMDLKQFIFYATSHQFVLGRNSFIFVALFPFVVISVFSVAGIVLLPGLAKWSISLFLFAHTTMCAGDFAMVSLFTGIRGRDTVTWDDAEQKTAWFYYLEKDDSALAS